MSTTDFFILNISMDNRAEERRSRNLSQQTTLPALPAASDQTQRGGWVFTAPSYKKSVMYWLAMLNNIMIEFDIGSCDDNRLWADRLTVKTIMKYC